MPTLARARQDAIHTRYEAVHRRVSKRMANHLRAFFRSQARRVVARYLAAVGIVKAVADPSAETLMPPDEEQALLTALEVYLLTMMMTTSALMALLVDATPIATTDVAARVLLAEAGNPVRAITEVTRRAIREHLADGARRHYTAQQIAYGVPDEGYRSLAAVVESAYTGRAEAIAATETARIGALTMAETYRMAGIERVLIRDGRSCGWSYHEDRDKADGSVRTVTEYRQTPLSHPYCIRQGFPILGRGA